MDGIILTKAEGKVKIGRIEADVDRPISKRYAARPQV
jgi:hypothetical protein